MLALESTVVWFHQLGQTKVQHFYLAHPRSHHDVGRFQVSVHNACGMRLWPTRPDLNRYLRVSASGKFFAGAQLIERLALDDFHGNEVMAVVGGDVINRDNVGWFSAEAARLPAQSACGVPGYSSCRRATASGRQADSVRVERLIDDAHAAFAKFFLDL